MNPGGRAEECQLVSSSSSIPAAASPGSRRRELETSRTFDINVYVGGAGRQELAQAAADTV